MNATSARKTQKIKSVHSHKHSPYLLTPFILQAGGPKSKVLRLSIPPNASSPAVLRAKDILLRWDRTLSALQIHNAFHQLPMKSDFLRNVLGIGASFAQRRVR